MSDNEVESFMVELRISMKYYYQLSKTSLSLILTVCLFSTATAKISTLSSVQLDSGDPSVVFPEISIDEALANLSKEIELDYSADDTVTIEIGRELQKIFGSERDAPYRLELQKFQAFLRRGEKLSLLGGSEDKAFCRLKVALIGSKGGFTEYEVLCSQRFDRFENSYSVCIQKAVEKALYKLIDTIDADI